MLVNSIVRRFCDTSKVGRLGHCTIGEALKMALNPTRFTLPRVFKSTLVAVGFVIASVSLWDPQILDSLPICMASLAAPSSGGAAAATATPPAAPATPPAAMKHDAMSSDMHAPTVFTLRTGIAEGRMVYIGVGGDINGAVNPTIVPMKARPCRSI
jgi:hypothetical protein